MYEADGNMVINHIARFDLAGLAGTAASDLPMSQSLPGFRMLRKNRNGDSLAPSVPILLVIGTAIPQGRLLKGSNGRCLFEAT